MSIKKILFASLFFLALPALPAQAQKLKSDNWEISFEKFEKQEVTFMGKKQIIYSGILKVKKDKKEQGTYRFYLPQLDGKLSHLTIRDMEDKILDPRLYYNSDDKTFVYYQGTPKEKKVAPLKSKNVKDLILSGMLIWLNREE